MSSPHILGIVPKDRTQLGRLLIADTKFCVKAYFKSDNEMAAKKHNSNRFPWLPYGDHPLGLYMVKVGRSADVFGPHPIVSVVGLLCDWMKQDGDAWFARQEKSSHPVNKGKRWGLAIHGGAPGANGQLRPTYGCVRLHDDDQAELVKLIRMLAITRYLAVGEP